jgi:hypothetical protein
MPVTELVFPVYKTDADSLAHLQENKLKIAQNYPKNINGLHAIYQGKIVEENGIIVKQPETRSVFFFGELTSCKRRLVPRILMLIRRVA